MQYSELIATLSSSLITRFFCSFFKYDDKLPLAMQGRTMQGTDPPSRQTPLRPITCRLAKFFILAHSVKSWNSSIALVSIKPTLISIQCMIKGNPESQLEIENRECHINFYAEVKSAWPMNMQLCMHEHACRQCRGKSAD